MLTGLDFDIEKLDVRIFYAALPAYGPMAGPLDRLRAYHVLADVARSDVAACVRTCIRSLVLASEAVDTKIQTESGIDLLDVSRRYNVGGATGGEYSQRQVLMRADSGAVFNNVNEAQMCWLSNVQATHDNLGISLLPPNSQVTQISAPAVQTETMAQLQQHYHASVHTHFNVRLDDREGSAQPATGALAELHNSVLQIARRLEDFLPQVYTFGTHPVNQSG